ncbi:Pre-mRNA-splicing ATP-dependent RNA helicase prp2 8 [Trichuris trichiura]|uniref:Pre-mRNA-splicing ATP-dependent RNA helicase prp2 8 n=1 Tax=Trichuris trichiura TaxID=36087 RepID=A0A077Z3W3_TRITR|nr:Pre-mRNA-splicing ATP-dependent RNA helicase prp2 8 [Trichuris trichiura]
MVVSGHDDLAYFLLVKVGSLVLTTLLVMITCLRCVGRNRLRVTAGFWRPDCYKKSRQRSEADEVDAANHTTSQPVASVPRTRPLSDFAPFSRTVRPDGLERSRSNSEIYAYVGKQQNFGHYLSNICSNPMQYDVPAYSQILENDGQTSDELYSQMHGHEFYDNIRDISPDNGGRNKAAVNSYDYPKFSPLPLKPRPSNAETLTAKQCANGSCFESHLYSAIKSVTDLDIKGSSSFPLHRSRLSRSHIGICPEPLYSVIQKQTPFMGRTVYVSGRMFPYSDPYIGRIGDLGDGSNRPAGLPSSPDQVVQRTRESEIADSEMPSCNYRYLSMREPLDVLRRRLEQQNGRNFFNSASDSSLHYYTSINESSDPGYEAVSL